MHIHILEAEKFRNCERAIVVVAPRKRQRRAAGRATAHRDREIEAIGCARIRGGQLEGGS
jgi:hypothetical protein